jgi:multisubunit Na+/H+ antiporter MnhC subunit
MRVLCGFGAAALLYLAVIPIGLTYSIFDSACAGPGCESSTLLRLALTMIYLACAATLLGTAALFAAYAARGGSGAERRLPRALALTGGVVGVATFSLFLIAYPAGGAFALSLAVATYVLVRLTGHRRADGPGPSVNGYRTHAPGANGNRALPGNRP